MTAAAAIEKQVEPLQRFNFMKKFITTIKNIFAIEELRNRIPGYAGVLGDF